MPEASNNNSSAQNLTVTYNSDSDMFLAPETKTNDPLPLELGVNRNGGSYIGLEQRPKATMLEIPVARHTRRSLRRSSSDRGLWRKKRQGDPITSPALVPSPLDGNRTTEGDNTRRLLQKMAAKQCPVQPALMRSASNTPLESRTRQNDPKVDSAMLQQQLKMQTSQTGKPTSRLGRVRDLPTADTIIQCWDVQSSSSPDFKWSPARSNSDPSSIPQVAVNKSKRGKDLPLKGCMKPKSKSATTTPPKNAAGSPDSQNLRRVKTVDFEEKVSSKLLSLPLLKVWTDEPNHGPSSRTKAYGSEGSTGLRKSLKRLSSCPGPNKKGKPADTAITRTDVHVVAIAPSWGINDVAEGEGIVSATPTMQFVESKTGSYEVVWNDVPPEDDVRAHRRSSSASLSLQTAASTATRGLDRVNNKLTEWSWEGGSPGSLPSSFRPHIVVFPDEDGHKSRLGCAVEDEDLIISAPPNSERTSAIPSRQPSGPPSGRASRSSSSDESELNSELAFGHPVKRIDSKQEALVVPNPNTSLEASGGMQRPPTNRRLSNIEDSEVKFRGHRDSVTLARSRNFNAGGVSPELFVHRDSVAMAKKRMHTRNHATLAARQIPQLKTIVSDSYSSVNGRLNDDESSPLAPQKLQSAINGLEADASDSILDQQPTNTGRHIRIIE